jgi:sensor histidine kinase YesM
MELFLSNFVLSNKLPYRLGRHTLFWLVCLIFFGFIYGSFWRFENINHAHAFVEALIFLPMHIFMSYLIIYFLLPRYLFTGKYFSLLIGIIVLVPLTAIISFLISQWVINPYRQAMNLPLASNSLFLGFMAGLRGSNTVAGFATAIKLVKYWYFKKEENALLEKEKLKAELEVLKGQLQPHFLFNTLNNLYSLVLLKSKDAPEVVLKLSELLRYILTESAKDKIRLTEELSIIKAYIALEQLRFGTRLDLTINIRGEIEDKWIAPLLILPIVENAFKHGANEMLEQSWVSLDISVADKQLKLKLINGKAVGNAGLVAYSTGIGLQNLQKRLNLIYPGKHELKTHSESETFMVSLQLELENDGTK